jgi:hypothetical protein
MIRVNYYTSGRTRRGDQEVDFIEEIQALDPATRRKINGRLKQGGKGAFATITGGPGGSDRVLATVDMVSVKEARRHPTQQLTKRGRARLRGVREKGGPWMADISTLSKKARHFKKWGDYHYNV